ncbi:hypothetical protein D3H65_18675 [Paraflavitalea soli]|uniref:Uncharacterized protein n=1 Tax=Paraflavitalea soli TaxID=2315862 RepID=A0A3B7MNZ6_9BACT|nr:hypothetical protein D3H65_18675 [Paraflavitalea soli]
MGIQGRQGSQGNETERNLGLSGRKIDKILVIYQNMRQYFPDKQINTTGENIVFKAKIYYLDRSIQHKAA